MVFAPHYAKAQVQAVTGAWATVHSGPDALSEASSQLLHGEGFAVLDLAGNWAWGYSTHDHYVGYVAADLLGEQRPATHIVSAREALVFAEPSIKSAVVAVLSLGARLVGTDSDKFVETSLGYVHQRHVSSIASKLPDYVATAEGLLGSPYRWGGRGAGGIDCSGLVQLVLGLAGLDCPRDTDQQITALGTEIGDGDALTRGDIIFFPGHVGLMIDEHNLIHANAYWMAVTIEPLTDVVARLAPEHEKPITGRRRIA